MERRGELGSMVGGASVGQAFSGCLGLHWDLSMGMDVRGMMGVLPTLSCDRKTGRDEGKTME